MEYIYAHHNSKHLAFLDLYNGDHVKSGLDITSAVVMNYFILQMTFLRDEQALSLLVLSLPHYEKRQMSYNRPCIFFRQYIYMIGVWR